MADSGWVPLGCWYARVSALPLDIRTRKTSFVPQQIPLMLEYSIGVILMLLVEAVVYFDNQGRRYNNGRDLLQILYINFSNIVPDQCCSCPTFERTIKSNSISVVSLKTKSMSFSKRIVCRGTRYLKWVWPSGDSPWWRSSAGCCERRVSLGALYDTGEAKRGIYFLELKLV
jgi:hypothetical protein